MARAAGKTQTDALPKRRRYDVETCPEKVIGDLKVLCSTGRFRSVFPTYEQLYRDGYENLAWAMRKIGYHASAEACGIQPDPHYWSSAGIVEIEIERVFLRPQWVGHENDVDFEEVLPTYSQLATHDEISQAVRRLGGMYAIYPERRWGEHITPKYYFDESNLRAEVELQMSKLRVKTLPTYEQLEHKCRVLVDVYLIQGGYLKLANRLDIKPVAKHLKRDRNLYFELCLPMVAEDRRDGAKIDEGEYDNIKLYYMPSEQELRSIRRTDLHHEVESRGGYYRVSKLFDIWLYGHFWKGNTSLAAEMRRVAYSLGRPKVLPTKDELIEIGRDDLVAATSQNGGYNKVAELCGLQKAKAVRQSEAPLRRTGCDPSFAPYPTRRFDPKLQVKLDGYLIRFEVSTSSRTGRGLVEEYGVWVCPADRPTSTLGRFGWVRRRPGHGGLWMHRLEGESHWDGNLKELGLTDAIKEVLCKSGLTNRDTDASFNMDG